MLTATDVLRQSNTFMDESVSDVLELLDDKHQKVII